MHEHSLTDADYLFLRIYSIDLQTAIQALAALDRSEDPGIRMCITRDIIVTYCRPFAGNRGVAPERLRHRLDEVLPGVVPERHRALHLELKVMRNTLFAHSDLDAYQPRVAKREGKGGPEFPMSFKGLYYEDLNGRIPSLRDLVESVEIVVNNEIRKFNSTLGSGREGG